MIKLIYKNKYIFVTLLLLGLLMQIISAYPISEAENDIEGILSENVFIHECENICVKGIFEPKTQFLQFMSKCDSVRGKYKNLWLLMNNGDIAGGNLSNYQLISVFALGGSCTLLSLIIILYIMNSDGKKRILKCI